ncbi:hypothetical protein ACTFIW_012598 [Dictyostelium discoideum]
MDNKKETTPKIINKEEIFFKIWRNISIRNEILYHLRLYNIYLNNEIEFYGFSRILNYKYKNYLNKIKVTKCHSFSGEILPYGITEISFDFLKLSSFDENTIPTSIYTINFGIRCEFDKINVIPNSVKTIKFRDLEREPLKIGILPSSLTCIEFNNEYNQPIQSGVLPSTIKSIKFGNSFNQSIKGDWIPQNIESLKFGKEFMQPIQDINQYLPKSITSLILPIRYLNEPINFNWKLSHQSSNDLIFYYDLNKSLILNKTKPKLIEHNNNNNNNNNNNDNNKLNLLRKPLNIIPNDVRLIEFGYNFNCSIQMNTLPLNLISIKFSFSFDKVFDFSGLINLTTLELGDSFNKPIQKLKFPPNLTCLSFGEIFNQFLPVGCFLDLPLKSLKFGSEFDQFLDSSLLPPTLTSLDLGSSGNFTSFKILNQLKSLKIGSRKCKPVKFYEFPSNLKEISYNHHNNDPINKGVIPIGVVSLSFDRSFNRIIRKGVLPNTIKTLSFNCEFNQIIEKDTLPIHLTKLTLECRFNQIFDKDVLPNSITSLSLGSSYSQDFPIGSLPSSLKKLKIRSHFFSQNLSCSFDDYFTSSLESIYITKNSSLVYILDPLFITKFIKFI